jgi:hypothetical protein
VRYTVSRSISDICDASNEFHSFFENFAVDVVGRSKDSIVSIAMISFHEVLGGMVDRKRKCLYT